MRKLLFGTRNQTRFAFIKEIVSDLPIELVSLAEQGIELHVLEEGNDPLQNALGKAFAYHQASGMPTMSIDAGLYIEKFPDDKQPGVYVKRIYPDRRDAGEEEMLAHYIEELNRCGGESKGYWNQGLALVLSESEILFTTYKRETLFTSKRSLEMSPGEPLNSIQIDPRTGNYVSQLTLEEKKASQEQMVKHIHQFLAQHLGTI
ncbi:non-canonical purine NTP pyrophosphatase [Paenibacillus cremeus]|uniref:Non-canonical purine NTP pyrophosphatase n=1 Tax=Paenibacillus cremeus TaxID=2163881 RepID=A0A559K6M7_9BACL|nr:non-canonical purine NTP pyrophosphatase [Paenibacillus cremeus]TVY07757.1 hypothetical protein FPZ49_22310 [Paenibacillus cremeus]